MKVKHLAIIPILLSLLYLLPIFSLEDKWIIFLQNYGNFFIYFILGLFLSVISSSTKRSSLLLLLACSSLISQTLQMSFDDRQFDFGTILLNILGSTAGIYFFFLFLQLLLPTYFSYVFFQHHVVHELPSVVSLFYRFYLVAFCVCECCLSLQ